MLTWQVKFLFCSLIALLVLFLQNYVLVRSDFWFQLACYTLLFAAYLFALKYSSTIPLKYFLAIGILARVILLFGLPVLSDDFYRFYWDGNLVANGINPYAYLPSHINTNRSFFSVLPQEVLAIYSKLNSPNYFSVYPPVNQVLFAFPALITKNILTYVIALKLQMLLLECLGVYFMYRLLQKINLDVKQLLWYWLNPLVFMEGVGNLHFEVLMVSFCLMAIFYFSKQTNLLAGTLFSMSVGVKLLPIIALPYLLLSCTFKNTIKYLLLILTLLVLMFLPFYDKLLLGNFFSSIELYFQTFEFNASIYNVLKYIGYQIYGYNTIATLGKILPALVFVLAMRRLWKAKMQSQNFAYYLEFCLWIYFLCASIVHPWYVISLVALVVFTKNYLNILWSFVVFLSYHFYSKSVISHHYFLWIEYGVLLLAFVSLNISSTYRLSKAFSKLFNSATLSE